MRYCIGIAGLKRSGKNTFADALKTVALERGLAFVAVAFADPLRDAAAAAYGVDVAVFNDDAKKDTVCPEWGITYRQMLINLGEAMRSVDPDHWVKAWRRRVDGERLQVSYSEISHNDETIATSTAWARLNRTYTLDGKPLDIVVAVPDVRRLNEAAAIHDLDGVNVLVRRPGVEWNGHVTEALSEIGSFYPKYLGQVLDDHFASTGQELRVGSWFPQKLATAPGEPRNRAVFDFVVDNDSDVASLRKHAVAVLDLIVKGNHSA